MSSSLESFLNGTRWHRNDHGKFELQDRVTELTLFLLIMEWAGA